MNIDGDRMLTNLDKSTDDYNCDIQKIMILQVIQHIIIFKSNETVHHRLYFPNQTGRHM